MSILLKIFCFLQVYIISVEKLVFSIIVACLKLIYLFGVCFKDLCFVFDFKQFNYDALTTAICLPVHMSIYPSVHLGICRDSWICTWFISSFENFLIIIFYDIASPIILFLLSFWDFNCIYSRTWVLHFSHAFFFFFFVFSTFFTLI